MQKHVELLTRLIEDPEYNRAEQLREFEAHWEILCRNTAGGLNELFVVWDGHEVEGLQVKPPRALAGSDLQKTHIALANAQKPESVCGTAKWGSRQIVGKALGVPLIGVEPAPTTVRNCRHGISVLSSRRTARDVMNFGGCARRAVVTIG